MDAQPLDISPAVRTRAELAGDAAMAWLASLPDLVASLQEEWAITLGEPIPGANEGYVAHAKTADGTEAVLKLTMPAHWRPSQATVLSRAAGRGYAHLIEADPGRDAMLMEALGSPLADFDWAPERVIAVLCATLREAWTLPMEPGLMDGQYKALSLADFIERIWRELDRPCPMAVIDTVRRYCERRAAAYCEDRAVHLHGDPHPGNALRVPDPRPGAASGFVFIDPDGVAAEPAYDLGVILAGWDNRACGPRYLLGGADARDVARWLCGLLAKNVGVDAEAVWEWGFIVRVATGVHAIEHGMAWGQDKLDVAARLV